MRSEMLENYVALSITNILAMLLLAFVVGRNNLLDRKMKRFFSTAIFCTILVILAEIGTSVFGQPVASFSLPNMFFNVLGFSLSPFITISLAFVLTIKITEIYFTCSFQLLPTCFWLCSRQNSV